MSRREYATSVDADWETFAFYPLMNNLLDVSGNEYHATANNNIFNDPYHQGRNSLYCHEQDKCLEVPQSVLPTIRANVGKGIRLSGYFIKSSDPGFYPNIFDFGHAGEGKGYNVQSGGSYWLIGINNQEPVFPSIKIPVAIMPINTPLYFEHTLAKNTMRFVLKKEDIVLVDETVTGRDVVLNDASNYLVFGACPWFTDRGLKGNIWDCKVELHI